MQLKCQYLPAGLIKTLTAIPYPMAPGLLVLEATNRGFFLVKTGKVSTTGFDHFLFQNNNFLGWAVINLSTIGITLDNIDSVSHVTLFSPAPEPAILTLLATGVAGLAGVRLRKKKQVAS
ncbi:PEP-CTERM sorting domain-containing protein [Desulfopila aestuarii]|uniref:PEP-CTERM protein-sorting domain-containing protein n=1 Tax=Desulfopila aestuarii DSM 18488 TaxID=1121416 RepID=A0A1M7YLP1_9BACT|nr:PEP-CTERM protein-sorting domain-containing protein [Desulfopila aestuarii DSM 18488]